MGHVWNKRISKIEIGYWHGNQDKKIPQFGSVEKVGGFIASLSKLWKNFSCITHNALFVA